MQPIILTEKTNTFQDLNNLKNSRHVSKIHDIFESQLIELFEIQNPSRRFLPTYKDELKKFIEDRNESKGDLLVGNWVYYPSDGTLVHTLNEDDYTYLRTNRNQNLISKEEQNILLDFTIGIFGLSVGGNMATNLAYSGISKAMKLADFDILETANLNRIHANITDIGKSKAQVIADQIYKINPYAELVIFDQGIDKNNLEEFFTNEPKPRVVFEELDDFVMKIQIRIEARKYRVPVIMLTSLGDAMLIDVERYDLDPNLPLFNGLIGNTPEEILSNPITEREKIKYAITIVGKEYLSNRVLHTLFEINKTLIGRPQLNSTVTIGSGLASYLSRRLALNLELPSGRTFINFEKDLAIQSYLEENTKERKELLDKLEQMVGKI